MAEGVRFHVSGSIMRSSNRLHIYEGEDPRTALCEQVIDSIATDVMVGVRGVKMHLAAWMDPDHWSDDWRATGTTPEELLGASGLD
jgi:hypothetical protein